MRTYFISRTCILVLLMAGCTLYAQPRRDVLMRGYWDNDFFNVRGQGTDESYTNGFRLDLFCQQKARSYKSILSRLFPMAGDSSVNIKGWGLGQMMMTPSDLTRVDYLPHDYPYAGALVVMHSHYSYKFEEGV